MRKLKQIAIALLMALMTCACVLGLSACEGQYVGDRDQLHEHTMVYHAQVDASCTKDGAEEYWQCTECKKIFSDAAGTTVIEAPEKLTASGHTWGDWIVVKEASCKGPGSETRTCSCGATQTQDISALDHTWGNQVTEGATCTEASKTTYTCSVCGDTKVEKGEALGHNFTKVDKVEATCTEPGNVEYYACSVCEKNYADPNGKTVLEEVVVAANGHTEATPATCTEKATCSVCEQPYGEPLGHYEIVVEGTPATCTEPGLSDGIKCGRCGDAETIFWVEEPVELDALGHEKIGDATCKVPALCERCGYYGEALPHSIETVAAVAPTCSAVGSEAYSACKNCDYVSVDTADENENGVYDAVEIAALNHNGATLTYMYEEEVPAECEKEGTEAYYVCSCGAKVQKDDQDVYVAVTDEDLVIEALEHDPNATVVEGGREPDCELTGICGLCGEEYADALGHLMVYTDADPQNCIEGGTTAYAECTRCDLEIGGEEIPADGHNLTYTAAVAPTCTETGMVAYWYCADCNSYFASTADANDADALEAEKAALLYDATADYVVDAENEIDERVVAATNHDNGNALIAVEGKANTCTENGYEAYVYCTLCDYTTYKVIPAAHTDVQEYAEDPASCYEDGLTAGKKCEDCGEVLEGLVVIPATNHAGTIIVKDVKVPATCISVGYTEGIFCTACNEYVARPQEIAMIEHAITKHDAVEKSCTVEGFIEYYTCANECCANTYYVIEDNAYVATTTVSLGYAAHTLELINAQAATCTANGWTKYKVCEDCGHYFNLNGVEIEAIPYIDALGHKFGDVIESDPTCTEVGYNKHKVCSVCEVAFKAYATLYAGLEHAYAEGAEVIPATGHTVQLQTKTLAVDCATPGHEAYYLCACGAKFIDNDVDATEFAERYTEIDDTYYNANIVIKAAHLNVKPVGALAATCVEGGYAAHLFCYTCNNVVVEANGEYVVSELVKYEAIGHTFGAVDSLAPTCTEAGRLNNVTCTVCSSVYVIENNKEAKDYAWSAIVEYTEEEVAELVKIDAVGHTWATFVAVDPTCTVEGYKAFRVCACNAIADTNEDGVWELISSLPVDATDAHVHCDTIEVYDDATSKYVAVASFADVKIAATGHLNVIIAPKKDATCTEIGYEQAKVCADCDTILEASETIPAKGHKFEVNIGTKATCEEDGVWAYAYCTVCMVTEGAANGSDTSITETEYGFKVLLPKATYADVPAAEAALATIMERVEYTTKNEADKIVIPAFGHGTAQSIVEVQEDCFTTGYEAFTTCGMYVYSVVKVYVGDDAKTGEPLYSYVLKATLAEGVNLDAYEVCNTVFVGEKAYALTAITDTLYDVDAEAIEVEEGETYFEIPEELVIARLAHEWTAKVEFKPADCDNYGWTEADVCIHCQKTGDVEIIEARGHVLELVPEDPEVCVDAEGNNYVGTKAHYICTHVTEGNYVACGKKFAAVWNEEKDEYEPAIGQDGKYVVVSDEDLKIDEQDGHELVEVEGVAATCTRTGIKTFWMCRELATSAEDGSKVAYINLLDNNGPWDIWIPTTGDDCDHIHCGLYFVEDEDGKLVAVDWNDLVIPATGHDWTYVEGEDTITTKPTCTATGVASGACKNGCGETSDEIIVPVVNEGGHSWKAWTKVDTTTCTTNGSRRYTCEYCGEKILITPENAIENGLSEAVVEALTATGHDYDVLVEYKAPVCEGTASDATGFYYAEECSVCGLFRYWKEVDKDGKPVGDPIETTEIDDLIIEALKHSYTVKNEEESKVPTCLDAGYDRMYCANGCGLYVDEPLEATGHNFGEVVPELKPTCDVAGNVEYKTCSVCEKNFAANAAKDEANNIADVVVPAKAHEDAQVVGAKPATCTTDGWIAHMTCECNNDGVIVYLLLDPAGKPVVADYDEEILVKAAHDWETVGVLEEATCYKVGKESVKCSVCNETNVLPTALKQHSLKYVPAVADTCDGVGNEAYYVCTVVECGKMFAADGKTVITEIPTVDEIKDHKPTLTNKIEATCTTDGTTGAARICSICNKVLDEDKIEKAIGHVFGELVVEVPTTCNAAGTKAHYKCETCGIVRLANAEADKWATESDDLVIAKLAHAPKHTAAVAGDCDTKACAEYWTCENENCGKVFEDEACTKETTVEALTGDYVHDLYDVAAKAPTCVDAGWNAHKKCSLCDYSELYNDGVLIAPNGHTLVIELVEEATEEKEGTIKLSCEVCGYSEEVKYEYDAGSCAHNAEKLTPVAEVIAACGGMSNKAHDKCECGKLLIGGYVVAESEVYYVQGHTWKVEGGVEIKDTCTTDGYCTVCDKEINEITGHDMKVVTKEGTTVGATHDHGGVSYSECQNGCGHSETENIDPIKNFGDADSNGKCDFCGKTEDQCEYGNTNP